jgi:site-specific DNA-methyltransferase (adenine-specific)
MPRKATQTSNSVEYPTPGNFFSRLNNIFHFELDVCATHKNAKCPRYFTKQQNGLKQRWNDAATVWMNPPYGKGLCNWMQKAYEESRNGCVIVCLVPVRSDTKWWHHWVEGKAQVFYVKGRLRFDGADYPAPFPSAIVIYGLEFSANLTHHAAGLPARNSKNPHDEPARGACQL